MKNNRIKIFSDSVKATFELGEKTGRLIAPGTVCALTGDLGSGKTVFVQGLAKGLDIPDEYYITSPTYTLINEYPGRHVLFHIDLYRIENMVDFEDIGLYDILYGKGIAAVEWAEKLDKNILSDYISFNFEIKNDKERIISINGCGGNAATIINNLREQAEVKKWV